MMNSASTQVKCITNNYGRPCFTAFQTPSREVKIQHLAAVFLTNLEMFENGVKHDFECLIMCLLSFGDLMVRLVCLTPERVVRVRALAGDID